MSTQGEIEAQKIDENFFLLVEVTGQTYLVHFAPPILLN